MRIVGGATGKGDSTIRQQQRRASGSSSIGLKPRWPQQWQETSSRAPPTSSVERLLLGTPRFGTEQATCATIVFCGRSWRRPLPRSPPPQNREGCQQWDRRRGMRAGLEVRERLVKCSEVVKCCC